MRKFLTITAGIIVAMLLFQNCQKSEFLVITGVVRDSITNLPIKGVYVVAQNEHYTQTASDGTFSLEGVKPGKIAFYVVSFNGYNQKYTSAIISDGRVNKVNFVLSPIGKPQIETGVVTNITLHTATVAGSLNLQNESWSQYGFCWSSSTTEPSLSDMEGHIYIGSSSSNVNFSYNITNLVADKTYYVRAFATSNAGTIYGNSVVFRTSELAVSQGLIAFYPFTGNFSEQSGNGMGVGYSNVSLTNDRFGNINSAISFPSSGFYYYYSPSQLFTSFNQFTFSFWFYKSSWTGADRAMICNAYPTINNIVRVAEDASPNKLYFEIKTASGITYKIGAASAPSLNNWHHVVALRNDVGIKLYIDGALQSSTNCDNQPIVIDNYGWGYAYLFFGWDWYYWNGYSGSLDDIRIYNRPLTNTEIQYLLNH